MDQSFNLQWKTFPDHLLETFKHLGEEGHFADVTLVSDDEIQIPAHKMVLSACSPVLKSLLVNNPHKNFLLYLRGIKQSELQAIVNFMYYGETQVFESRINEFISVAQDLEIKEIGKMENGQRNDKTEKKPDEAQTMKDESKQFKPKDEDQLNCTEEENDIEGEAQTPDVDLNINRHPSETPIYSIETDPTISVNEERVHLENSLSNEIVNSENSDDVNLQPKDNLETKMHPLDSKRRFAPKRNGRNSTGRYKCEQCDYRAEREGTVRSHVESAHEGRTFNCDQCEFSSGFQKGLSYHKQRKHPTNLGIFIVNQQ